MTRLYCLTLSLLFFYVATAQPRIAVPLSGDGWKLWYDENAEWRNDEIVLTPVDIGTLPVQIPTGGWDAIVSGHTLDVSVPGTVEEYLQKIPGPEGAIDGVSWWTRTLNLPAYPAGHRVILKFESIRHRAEVFVDRRLVGYEIVGNSPFDVDITDYVRPGKSHELAVRITDPGGNYDWRDSYNWDWNGKKFPLSHGFGGINGRVYLDIHHPVNISDIYVQNTPAITAIRAWLTVDNTENAELKRDISLHIRERGADSPTVHAETRKNVSLLPGRNEILFDISVPEARLWDTDNPNLYVLEATLVAGNTVTDEASQRFGFRWFAAEGVGEDAVFRLNGKRIVLRSAISWGFWPVNGLYPTDELAKRQILVAKELGLNMLNFHRAIGQPNVFDYADELGLLYYEEPGAYKTGFDDPFTQYLLREKVLRMVKRDRSHPSLVIYNLMNESGDAAPDVLEVQMRDMADMHRLDPSRMITRTSGWAKGDDVDDQSKLHLMPWDPEFKWNGYYDYHHAGGPATWSQELYQNPRDYYNNTTNCTEIVLFGEEGAVSSPPRLEKNKVDLDKLQYKGWDGEAFLQWYDEFESFIDRKNLREVYPTVDTLTVAMGRISFEHQGRKIQLARINNYTDGYIVNGWESELIENYSGIVDCFRYPKSTPSIIARYNEPLYIAVMPRKQIVETETGLPVDFFIVNERDVKGPHRLEVKVIGADGEVLSHAEHEVRVSGGETYGELLYENHRMYVGSQGGLITVQAELLTPAGETVARGIDQVLVVDLGSNTLAGKGAVWENGTMITDFLDGRTQNPVTAYTDDSEKLDWVIVSAPPKKEYMTLIPSDFFRQRGGERGVTIRFNDRTDFDSFVHEEKADVVNLSVVEGATPNPNVPTISHYAVEWEGTITPEITGEYTIGIQTIGRNYYSLAVNGIEVFGTGLNTDKAVLQLEAGEPVEFRLRFTHRKGNSRCRLVWSVPYPDYPDARKLLDRARNDGTTVYLLENITDWTGLLEANSGVRFEEEFKVGSTWLGGVMFNRPHPLFRELPQGDGMNWPYQAIVRNGPDRYGFVVEGENLIAGAYHTYPMKIGTAMGEIPMGKGRVIFSTFDIYDNIVSNETAALTAKKILLNMIDHANE